LTNSGAKTFLPFFFFTFILSILAPLLAKIFYLSISRRREYLADATAVRFTRYPEGLASALETIASSGQNLIWFNKITAPMYIVNPEGITPTMDYFETKTHPPLFKRIEILRELQHSNNVSFRNYQSIYSKKFKNYDMIPKSALKDASLVSTIIPKNEKKSKKKTIREVENILLATNGFLFLTCSCGLKIKAPAKIGKSKMQCPRCGKYLILPSVTSTISHLDEKTKPIKNSTMKYTKKTKGWESFSCKCGHTIQLSPLFKGREINCKKCGAKIEVDYL
jgi:heat shock protein HtpX